MTARPAVNVHDLIEQEASAIQAAAARLNGDYRREFPNAAALVDAAITALEDSLPDRLDYEGRIYRLRARLVAVDVGFHVDVARAKPMLRVVTEGVRWLGFKPGH